MVGQKAFRDVPADLLLPNLPSEVRGDLPADLLTFTISAGRKWAGESAGRFADSHQICWQKWAGKSASRFIDFEQFSVRNGGGKSAGRFANFDQICQQKWGDKSARKLTVTKSAGRKGGVNLSADC